MVYVNKQRHSEGEYYYYQHYSGVIHSDLRGRMFGLVFGDAVLKVSMYSVEFSLSSLRCVYYLIAEFCKL